MDDLDMGIALPTGSSIRATFAMLTPRRLLVAFVLVGLACAAPSNSNDAPLLGEVATVPKTSTDASETLRRDNVDINANDRTDALNPDVPEAERRISYGELPGTSTPRTYQISSQAKAKFVVTGRTATLHFGEEPTTASSKSTSQSVTAYRPSLPTGVLSVQGPQQGQTYNLDPTAQPNYRPKSQAVSHPRPAPQAQPVFRQPAQVVPKYGSGPQPQSVYRPPASPPTYVQASQTSSYGGPPQTSIRYGTAIYTQPGHESRPTASAYQPTSKAPPVYVPPSAQTLPQTHLNSGSVPQMQAAPNYAAQQSHSGPAKVSDPSFRYSGVQAYPGQGPTSAGHELAPKTQTGYVKEQHLSSNYGPAMPQVPSNDGKTPQTTPEYSKVPDASPAPDQSPKKDPAYEKLPESSSQPGYDSTPAASPNHGQPPKIEADSAKASKGPASYDKATQTSSLDTKEAAKPPSYGPSTGPSAQPDRGVPRPASAKPEPPPEAQSMYMEQSSPSNRPAAQSFPQTSAQPTSYSRPSLQTKPGQGAAPQSRPMYPRQPTYEQAPKSMHGQLVPARASLASSTYEPRLPPSQTGYGPMTKPSPIYSPPRQIPVAYPTMPPAPKAAPETYSGYRAPAQSSSSHGYPAGSILVPKAQSYPSGPVPQSPQYVPRPVEPHHSIRPGPVTYPLSAKSPNYGPPSQSNYQPHPQSNQGQAPRPVPRPGPQIQTNYRPQAQYPSADPTPANNALTSSSYPAVYRHPATTPQRGNERPQLTPYETPRPIQSYPTQQGYPRRPANSNSNTGYTSQRHAQQKPQPNVQSGYAPPSQAGYSNRSPMQFPASYGQATPAQVNQAGYQPKPASPAPSPLGYQAGYAQPKPASATSLQLYQPSQSAFVEPPTQHYVEPHQPTQSHLQVHHRYMDDTPHAPEATTKPPPVTYSSPVKHAIAKFDIPVPAPGYGTPQKVPYGPLPLAQNENKPSSQTNGYSHQQNTGDAPAKTNEFSREFGEGSQEAIEEISAETSEEGPREGPEPPRPSDAVAHQEGSSNPVQTREPGGKHESVQEVPENSPVAIGPPHGGHPAATEPETPRQIADNPPATPLDPSQFTEGIIDNGKTERLPEPGTVPEREIMIEYTLQEDEPTEGASP